MTALTPNIAGHQDLSQFASRFVDVEALAWQPSKFDGVEFKTLLIDPDTGILKLDEDGEVTSGNFVWRPSGSRHSAHAPEGALILAIFLKPNRFYSSDGSQTDMLGRDYDTTWG